MSEEPSDYPVARPADEPDAGTFLEESEEPGVEPKADRVDVAEQQLPPPGDDEQEAALDLLEDRSARSDEDRPV